MQLRNINLCYFKADGGAMFGAYAKSNWHPKYPCDENNLITLALQSLVIEHDNRLILIDSGFNPELSPELLIEFGVSNFNPLAQIIENIGYNVSDVTDVIHTHLHVDHCGGSFKFNTNGFEPVFPKANYWLSAQQLENALNPTAWEEPSFQPQVIKAFKEYHLTRWIDKSQYILPWLQCRLYYGHTPGLIVPIIFDTECKHVFCSDLIPTTEHLTLQCISAYDINPSLVFEEKKLLHEEVNRGGYSLIFQHEE